MSLDVALREQVRAALREELPALAEALAEALEVRRAAHPYATREECARFLNISPRSLDTLRGKGLPTLWVLESPRFDLEKVAAWVATQGPQE
jgi:hypothetical protein